MVVLVFGFYFTKMEKKKDSMSSTQPFKLYLKRVRMQFIDRAPIALPDGQRLPHHNPKLSNSHFKRLKISKHGD